MTSPWQGFDLSDPTARRAILATVVLHGLVLAAMGFYLLKANVSTPKVSQIVFEFPKKVALPLKNCYQSKCESQSKPFRNPKQKWQLQPLERQHECRLKLPLEKSCQKLRQWCPARCLNL